MDRRAPRTAQRKPEGRAASRRRAKIGETTRSARCYRPPPVRLSVVIPALDEAERIAEAVASARAPDVEVIVVDGGSSDDTASAPRRRVRA